MSGNRMFRGIGGVLAVAILAGCTLQEVLKEEAPPPEETAKDAPASKPPEEAAAPAPQPAVPEAPAAAPAAVEPPAPQRPVLEGPLAEKFKDVDPSLLIYLSARGVVAGTGDPAKIAGDAEKAGGKEHPAALELSGLPKDQYGLIDWATAIKSGKVKPLDSLDPTAPPMPPFNLDIVIKAKSRFMPDVVYPHYTHTLWLTCTNCHTKIFNMKAGGNPDMTMPKIAAGEYCGRCHNRVAFPLSDCTRCHVKPKEASATGAQP